MSVNRKKKVVLYLIAISVSSIICASIVQGNESALENKKATVTSTVYSTEKKILNNQSNIKVKNDMEMLWNEALEKHKINQSEWLDFDLGDLKELEKDPPEHLIEDNTSKEELSDANLAGIGQVIDETLQHYRERGDSLPLILIHKKLKVIKLVFQRDFGNGDFIVITLDQNTSQKNLNFMDTEKNQKSVWSKINVDVKQSK
ncbi:hypothetical protein [Paenibacillus sinopodophylli]|uniref:hypothetical protein n=1 Tax=Paenibacillus sinopodophylli TaxID=1837342 RepID=UPI00110D0A19|nr:hypothetical protein [Paenibacillus sinopodophylli]